MKPAIDADGAVSGDTKQRRLGPEPATAGLSVGDSPRSAGDVGGGC